MIALLFEIIFLAHCSLVGKSQICCYKQICYTYITFLFSPNITLCIYYFIHCFHVNLKVSNCLLLERRHLCSPHHVVTVI